MQVKSDKLKELLLDSGMVSRPDVESAEEKVSESDQRLSDVLISEGVISEDDLRRMQAYLLGVPFMQLKPNDIDTEVLRSIPEPIARKHNIIPYQRRGKSQIEVAMLDVDNIEGIDFVRKKTGAKVLPRLTDTESIKNALLQYQKSLKAEFGDIIEQESKNLGDTKKETETSDSEGDDAKQTIQESASQVSQTSSERASEEDLKKMADDLPVVRIIDTLLEHAVVQGASDVHLEPMENQVLVRYRIDGVLEDAMVLPKGAAAGLTARVKVLADLKLDEKRLPQDGRFKTETGGEKISLRVSTLPTSYGEKTVMRLLRESVQGYTLETLGFHGKGLEDFHNALNQSTGMILVTGPTGSGKSTTLYTALDILNTPDVNISTVEDPVEYQMDRINQTQVKPDIGFDFSSGLRALLRQDPDKIMVGEIRDGETADLAINAALTGHLVLSTLHTNSSAGAIPRLVDMGAESFLLVSTVQVIVAQRLLRRLCQQREKYYLGEEERATLEKQANLERVLENLKEESIVNEDATIEDIPFFRAKPSNECEDGYSGRVGIYEVLGVSSSVKELIRENASAEKIQNQAREEGMMTMVEDGVFKAAQGLTSIEEVLRVVND